MTDWNVGPAILIIGGLYLMVAFNLNWLLAGVCFAVGLTTWDWMTYSDERKRIIKARARYWEAKAINEERKSR